VDGLRVFMFMHAILPQEWLQALIDNPVEAIDTFDEHALHRRMPMHAGVLERLRSWQLTSVAILATFTPCRTLDR
jgi:hypothetical protein